MAAEQPRVFISYARADDEPFVKRLHCDLEAAGIEVWWDRDTMASRGRTFLQEIRDAIEAVDRVIAVIGPAATQSDYVRYEWDHAALFAKGLLPILRLGDYSSVPSELLPENDKGLAITELGKLHCPDFRVERPYEQALDELVAVIRQPVPPLASYDGTPALPPHFLPRPDDLRRLKDTVLADVQQPTVITSAKQTAALQGMGGIGKSVMAAAFGRAVSTRRAMANGIFWLKVGQDATRLTLLANMQAVGSALGDARENYLDEVFARQHLSKLLADKVCLIVLDDVWSIEQAEPFRDALGPRCRLLVTTRDGSLVTALEAQEHRVDVLSTDQALALLAEWSTQSRDKLADDARQVASQCGSLPLALALCGAMARDGTSWRDLSDALRETDLAFIEARLPNYPFPNVLRALSVSVEMLGREDRATVERYHELAVFPRKALVPEAAVLVLWCRDKGLSERNGRKSLTIRGRKALLTLEGDSPNRRVSFHDLQYDYLQAIAIDSIATLHGTLISAYRSKCLDDWASGPNDGYFFQFLPMHLAEAGRREELRAVLLDYPWLQAKLKATDVQALTADCDLLPEDADIRLLQGAIRLSIPALARDPGQLASQLVGRLFWAGEEGLGHLRKAAEAEASAAWFCPKGASLQPAAGPLIQTFAGHTGSVRGATVLADGRRALSWSRDGTLRLWDLEAGTVLHALKGHSSRVYDAIVLADGRRALSWSEDGTLRLWDLASGQSLHTLEGKLVNGALVLADGARALSWSRDGTLRLWNLATGTLLHTLEGHSRWVEGALVLAAGRRALSWACDGTLRLWDLAAGTPLHTFEGHTNEVLGATVLADGRRALSWACDGTLRLWDLAFGTLLHTFEGHSDRVLGAIVLGDGGRALSWSEDGTLRLWDLEAGTVLRALEGHSSWVRGAIVLADGRRALSRSDDGTLRLWDLASGTLLHTFEGHEGIVWGATVLADGRVLSWSQDRTLRLWDLAAGTPLHTFEGHINEVLGATVLADGRRALSWACDGTLRLWDLAAGAAQYTPDGHTDEVLGAMVLGDGGRALSWSYDGTLRLWDLAAGVTLHTLEGHSGWVCGATVFADGHRALSWSRDGTLRLWDLATGMLLHTLEGHTCEVWGAAVFADGRRALSWAWDGTPLRLWDLATGTLVRTLDAGDTNQGVAGAIVLADGRRALSWYLVGKTLQLWDLEAGTVLHALKGHSSSVRGAIVLADGRRALSWSWDRTLRLWDLETGTVLRALEGHSGAVNDAWPATRALVKGPSGAVNGAFVLADGRRTLSWSDDGTLRLWDLASGQSLHTLEGHTKEVEGVLALAGGTRALSWSEDGTLRLWDLASGRTLHTFEGHTRRVDGALLLAGGTRALSWSQDWSLILWDLASGRAIARFIGEAEITFAVAARHNLFVAGAANGALHILELRGVL